MLARYTCIALQRLGGSAKKVKGECRQRRQPVYMCRGQTETIADGATGSLSDKTMRLPMDNPIFIKLQEMVENAPKSPHWSVDLSSFLGSMGIWM